MKPIYFFLALFFCACLNIYADTCHETMSAPTVYEQLCDLNKYWCAHPSTDPYLQTQVEFADHEKLIRLHLATVENTLRRADMSRLNATQRANRLHCLDILHSYWLAGVFPKNTGHNYTVPYFIDRYNTACAVGHLIRETGYKAVATRIAREMNYAYIEQMPYPEISQWADKMGFAVDELKWIQPAYSPPFTIQTSSTEANCGDNNGSLSATFTSIAGGNMPESVAWRKIDNNVVSTVGQTASISQKSAGFYKIVAISSNGMFPVITKTAAISDLEGPQVTATLEDETCFNSKDGSIAIDVSGGVAPYNVVWYDADGQIIGNNTLFMGNLVGTFGGFMEFTPAPSRYTVAVSDANGCKTYRTYELNTLHMEGVNGWPSVMQQPTCGSNDGSIQVLYADADSDVSWSHDPTLHSLVADNLSAGYYTVTISNAQGCSQTAGVSLYNTSSFTADFSAGFSIGQNYCDLNTGYIHCPEGNNYTYQWSHDANLHVSYADNLAAGLYQVTVTNENNCRYILPVSISNQNDIFVAPNAALNNANSSAGILGSINLGAEYGNYQYTWSHNPEIDTTFVNNLLPGLYDVTISSNTTGCSRVFHFEILDENPAGSGTNQVHYLPANIKVKYADNNLYVHYTSDYALTTEAVFTLYDLNGREIRQQQAAEQGANTLIPAADLPTGLYLMTLHAKGHQSSVKFMLTR